MDKVINQIIKFYKGNGYDTIIPIAINDLVELTELSENEVVKIVKDLDDKGYLVEFCWKDKESCEFYLNDLGKEKILNLI